MYGVSLCTVQETPTFATSKPVVVTVTTALVVELGVLKLNSEKIGAAPWELRFF